MTEPPKIAFTKQHRTILIIAGIALIGLGVLEVLSFVDILRRTYVEGPGIDPRLYFALLGGAMITLGIGAIVTAITVKIE